jgi:hypothetical protein
MSKIFDALKQAELAPLDRKDSAIGEGAAGARLWCRAGISHSNAAPKGD